MKFVHSGRINRVETAASLTTPSDALTARILIKFIILPRIMITIVGMCNLYPMVLYTLLITIDWTPDTAAERSSSSDSVVYSTNTLARLYATIRNVAFPPGPAIVENEHISHRLVMLLPGKILHYYDYFPGDEEETKLNNGQEMLLPPRVMENMFHLTDVTPGIYPLRGTESGESMSSIYSNVLQRMEVKGFIKSIRRHSNKVMNLLKKEVTDPRNPSRLIPIFKLYRQLKDAHVLARLEMENLISDKRKELSPLKFEEWYQRYFPVLNSKVEGAFTELQMLQRNLHDDYRSELGVDLVGLDLEEAKVELRALALASLDRSRTVYPVSFVPANWYQYLATPQQRKQYVPCMLSNRVFHIICSLAVALEYCSHLIGQFYIDLLMGLVTATPTLALIFNCFYQEHMSC